VNFFPILFEDLRYLPKVLYKLQKKMVNITKAVFHTWASLMVDIPRNINIMVSDELDNIFMAYFTVV
jgi:hypothetical protein